MHALEVNEIDQVSGAGLQISWPEIGVGLGMFSLGLAIAGAAGLTGGLGLGVILGAGYGGEIMTAAFAAMLAGGGGYMAGNGIEWDQ